MKILYLSGFILPSRAAHGVHAMKMCQALARNGHEVTLFACGRCGKGLLPLNRGPDARDTQGRDGDPKRDESRLGRARGPQRRIPRWGAPPTGGTEPVGTRTDALATDLYRYYGVDTSFSVKRLSIGRFRGGTVVSLPGLYRALKTYDPGAVLVYARSPYGASVAARMGFRIVYEAHSPPPHILIRGLEKRLLASRTLQKLVVISESLKRIYLSIYGPIPRVEVCHDAADIPSAGSAVEYPWPGRAGRLQVGYTGHLFRGRGIEIILECARRLPQHDFHIAGGTEPDIRYWKRRGSANVHFHGFIEPFLVPAVLGRCDVLLAPYRKGLSLGGRKIDTSGWMSPMKLFEYMAARRAIIASDLPVLREVLHEGHAILVPPEDLDGWVSALRQCENRDYRDCLAAAAYEQFRAKYTWEKRAAQALMGVSLD